MGGATLGWCPYTPYVNRPLYIWIPPYVQQILIGYLFCTNIKYFPTLETVRGVVRLRSCPYAPYVHTLHTFRHPQYI